jgi:type IV secretion system protein VirD4
VLLVAPPRKGKGVSSIIPTALTWPHSLIVHDPKGEAWQTTSTFRRQELGHTCLRFDPTCNDGTGTHCNPLLEIRPWPYDVRDALTIVEALIERELLTSTKEGKHWDDTAAQFLVALLLHVLYAEPDKSLVGCLQVMTNPYRTLAQTLEVMRTTHHDENRIYDWTDPWTGKETQTHPVVASAVRAVENKSAKERDSVISSAVAHFTLYYDSIIAGNIQDSSFALGDVLDPQQRVSLYLTTPSSDVDHVMPLLRVIVNLALRRMTEKMEDPTRGWARSDVWRLLLLLDEFPQLGKIPTLQTKLAVLASYGVKTFLVAQDLEQIYEKYGVHESITSTCDVQTYFAPNKYATAEWISKRIGPRTVHREQRTYTGPRFAMYLPHMIASEGESQRPLLTPDEIMRLSVGSETDPRDPGEAVILVTGYPPIRGRKIRFYQDREFSQRTDPRRYPPVPKSDRIDHDWSRWIDHVAVLGTASVTQISSHTAVPTPAAAATAPPPVVVSPPLDEPLY